MKDKSPYTRHPSAISEKKLSERLGLYWDNSMQDWDLVNSDSERINEFLKVYQNELIEDDDRFTLMGLIVSSSNNMDFIQDKEFSKSWIACKAILENECFLHYSTIKYWSFNEDINTNYKSAFTPFIRTVWEKVKIHFL